MCEKTLRPGSGRTNIGVIAQQTLIGLIRFTQTFTDRSKTCFSETKGNSDGQGVEAVCPQPQFPARACA